MKEPTGMSWYQPEPTVSLGLVESSGVSPAAPFVEIGGGASTLVDRLLEKGRTDLTVLDISARALDRARERLGADADKVAWVVGDALRPPFERRFTFWHDRAFFHFLTKAADRAAYLAALRRHLGPDGWVVIATFAPDGPETCSGLPVRRYDAEALAKEIGTGFEPVTALGEVHTTPWGTKQPFQYVLFRRTG